MTLLPGPIVIPTSSGSSIPILLSGHPFVAALERQATRKADRIDAAGFASDGVDVEGPRISPVPTAPRA